jgi:hypothetical protein
VLTYSDYEGPQDGYAVVGGKLVSTEDPVAATALAQNAMVLALGDPEYVAELAAASDAALATA